MDLSQAKAEAIGHLGLVAAMIQDMGIMETIDSAEAPGWIPGEI